MINGKGVSIMIIDDILKWLNENPTVKQVLFLVGILLLSYVSYLITRKFFLKWLAKLIKRTKTSLDDIFYDKVFSNRLSYIVPILIIYNFAYLTHSYAATIQRIAFALIFLIILMSISAFLDALNKIYEQKEQFKNRPIKGYIQAATIVLYIVGALVMIGILTGQSFLVLLSGLGALTAIIILVFRDTILSFIASLQIATNDLVRLGDWIEVPKYEVDGDVIDIALHIVKIQNFDKTISVIPTHKLIEATFKNWRGMQESGGRRIKRSIFIDIDSIKFCDEKMLEKFQKIELLKDYLDQKIAEIEKDNKNKNVDMNSMVNARRLTNIGTFRAYIEAYLRNHKKISNDMTFLVRQLAPGPTGLPIEMYVFTTDVRWVNYEDIQADIFDHLLAVTKEFNLRTFQYPGGKDFQGIRL
jgi:miniconductance mechanosensitive channel